MITVVQVDRKDAAVRKLVLPGDARIKTGDPISAVRIRGCNVHFPNNLRSRRLGYLLNFGSKGCAYTSKFNVCIFELTNAAAPQRKHPWQVLPNDVGNHRTLVVLEGHCARITLGAGANISVGIQHSGIADIPDH